MGAGYLIDCAKCWGVHDVDDECPVVLCHPSITCPSCSSKDARIKELEEELDTLKRDIDGESTRIANETVSYAVIRIKEELDKIGHKYYVAHDEYMWQELRARIAKLEKVMKENYDNCGCTSANDDMCANCSRIVAALAALKEG